MKAQHMLSIMQWPRDAPHQNDSSRRTHERVQETAFKRQPTAAEKEEATPVLNSQRHRWNEKHGKQDGKYSLVDGAVTFGFGEADRNGDD